MKPELPIPPSAGAQSTPPAAEPMAPAPDAVHVKLAELSDLNLRLAADFENFKRRSRLESEARATAQKEAFILELLPVIDNLERALASGAAPGSPQLRQGVEMTLQQLRLLLRQHGIEGEASVGQTFDPHRHDAVSQRREPGQPDHAILEVFQSGYRRGEKVFRPAKVVVNALAHPKHSGHAR